MLGHGGPAVILYQNFIIINKKIYHFSHLLNPHLVRVLDKFGWIKLRVLEMKQA